MSELPTIEIYRDNNDRHDWKGHIIVAFMALPPEDVTYLWEKVEQLGLELTFKKVLWFAFENPDDIVGLVLATSDRFKYNIQKGLQD
ncbi:hypothetical protein FDI40_gp185 [Agrobacterium phage Atu_ph07]|uniref:Uncharacterized protein n=1 Tax=Agrobacterium phage Atu_ph07 TaxID=2024264 RepID=A0A2L0UZL1_9CAUD|nr:hypothetical protein FDI40_gp185 [Agrobacterium phage Atu_ph07]AUZ94967.1 hypothetical protein [Agrobacterium phage Atu_ph07]